MLTAKILNPGASVNSYKAINSFGFLPGTGFTLNFQLWEEDEDLRYFPASGAVITIDFQNTDGTVTTKTATALSDRSMYSVTVLASESQNMIGGNLVLTVTEGTDVSKGLIVGALSKYNNNT